MIGSFGRTCGYLGRMVWTHLDWVVMGNDAVLVVEFFEGQRARAKGEEEMRLIDDYLKGYNLAIRKGRRQVPDTSAFVRVLASGLEGFDKLRLARADHDAPPSRHDMHSKRRSRSDVAHGNRIVKGRGSVGPVILDGEGRGLDTFATSEASRYFVRHGRVFAEGDEGFCSRSADTIGDRRGETRRLDFSQEDDTFGEKYYGPPHPT